MAFENRPGLSTGKSRRKSRPEFLYEIDLPDFWDGGVVHETVSALLPVAVPRRRKAERFLCLGKPPERGVGTHKSYTAARRTTETVGRREALKGVPPATLGSVLCRGRDELVVNALRMGASFRLAVYISRMVVVRRFAI